jgi:hypothetical protein
MNGGLNEKIPDSLTLNEKILLYRRIREHEDTVMNHRIVWMWTLQALLFAAFSLILEKGNESYLGIICFVGLLSCFSIGYSLTCSWKFLDEMKEMGEKILEPNGISEEDKNIILGSPKIKPKLSKLLPWKFLPWLMGGAWLIFIVIIIFKQIQV